MSPKIKLLLTNQEFEDLASCISIAHRHFDKKGENPKFMEAISKLNKKIWKQKRKLTRAKVKEPKDSIKHKDSRHYQKKVT